MEYNMKVLCAIMLITALAVTCVKPFTAGPNCPWKVTVTAESEDRAYIEHNHLYQNYYAEPGTVNGKAHWTSEDGTRAIWYDAKFKNWKIGKEKNR